MSKKKKEVDHYRSYNYESGTLFGISFSDNPEQRELIRLINENNRPIIFCFGDAGTGKTFTTVAASLDLVKIKKKYSKIYYIREPLEVGKSLGFLPGDIAEKYGVYLGGLDDNLFNISQMTGLNVNDMKMQIECIPPQFTRGRSFESSIIIVDESQNLSLDTIQTLCTRLGKYCKIIFLGSLKQIDLRNSNMKSNDFAKAYDILATNENTMNLIGRVDLIKSERSVYCKVLDEAFNDYKANNGI